MYKKVQEIQESKESSLACSVHNEQRAMHTTLPAGVILLVLFFKLERKEICE